MLIYKITNTVNGKIYVGQTVRTLEERKWQHINTAKKGHKNHLYNAMRKYGIENFKFEKICDVDNIEDLNILERYYIAKYNCIKDGYNMVDGGNNNVMFLDDVKRKHSERMRSKETRSKISRSMKQYRKEHPFTEEHRRKLSEKASKRVYKGVKKVKKTCSGNIEVKRCDTRSIGCYCITENGDKFDFHSYRDAWNWWKTIENPFNTNAECVYQRKIKQSIDLGYFTYGRNKIKYEYPKWYRGGDLDDKKVTNP